MSNRVTIQPTKFVNLVDGNDSEVTYGVRVYDDYGNSYSNIWELSELMDDMEILKKVCSDMNHEETMAMISYVIEKEIGLYIGSNWYEWEEIKQIVTGE